MTDRGFTLPDAPARALYRQILHAGGRIRIADIPPEDAETVQSLLDLGLLKPYVSDGSLSAVNPRSVTARVGADLRAAGTRLLRQADELPDLLGDLVAAYDSAPRDHGCTGSTHIVEGAENIRHRISQLSEDLLHEALSLHPGGARPADAADDILDHARRFLGLGGSIRTLYESGARFDPGTVLLAARLTELGCHIRVAPFALPKMMVFDRTVAVIPAGADAAAFVEDPATVAFLAEVFENYWRLAEGVNWSALADTPTDLATPEQVGPLLARGLTQRAIATRLGLSERTVAAHIARLRELYDAETLFQLGWQMRGTRNG
ncbi:LuxR C-terminal-related transcriptional regulator [Streptomyces sp. NRRL WC-3742]|uniref:LuxR C-terminal-related transcriptional regulator n=1 Tax=Streptomyces sp. NRRL WC-3742 TaxID=1463934 RepID=UPI0004C6C534|nr:winged helix-turn-helix transcriptional regulator [Streptomyces sp. NRRL WC-3742]